MPMSSAVRCLVLLLIAVGGLSAAETALNVRDFAAKGDGTTLDTEALQKALDAAAAQGGGTVVVPPGRYLTGTLQLRSHVRLDLQKDAVLLGSTDPKEYPPQGAFHDGLGVLCNRVLISAREVEDVAVTGEGTIDGQGEQLQKIRPRPFLVRFQKCKKVALSGVTLTRSAMWNCHLWASQDVTVNKVTITPGAGINNNDGIDIDASSDVTIRDCAITSGDDAICMKATVDVPCRRVTITGCTLDSTWNGFKIGTESLGDFEDITMTDCVFTRNAKGGIRVYSVDGANIRRIRLENITIKNASLPVYFRLGARLKTFTEGGTKKPVGSISDVVVKNIHGPTHGSGTILLTGIPGHPITNVRIEGLDCTTPGGDEGKNLGTPMTERENAYPEPYTIFGPLTAYGIILRHVTDCTVAGATITCLKPDARPGVVCIDAQRVQLDRIRLVNPGRDGTPNLFLLGCAEGAVTWTGWTPVLGAPPSAATAPRPEAKP